MKTNELMKRRNFVKATALGGTAILLASCTPPASATPVVGAPTAVPAPTAMPAPTAVPAPTASPVLSTLRISSNGDIDTLDPHVSQLITYGNQIRNTVMNSLVKYAPDLSYVGDLAESWENPDDKTYIFRLRDGLTYHSGQSVEASHVEFSYKRLADGKNVWAGRLKNVAGYQVIDKKTIQINLKETQADFLDGCISLSIISPEIVATIDTKLYGTGPFKLVSWKTNDTIALEANQQFHFPKVPKVDTLDFKIIPEDQIAVTNLQSGDVDAVLTVPMTIAAPLKGAKDVVPVIVPTSSFPLFEMIGKNNKFIRNSAKVRQALALCLDKDAVKATVYNGEGNQKWSFVPTSHWAYKDIKTYAYDPAGAKALLAAEKINNLEFTVLCIQGYPDGEKTAVIWQAGLAEAGITMKIEVQELSVWLDNYINHTYDVIWNVFPGFADPNYFVSLGLDPHFKDGWGNKDAAKLAVEANQTLDQAKRKELYAQLQDMTVADLPVLVIQETPMASLTAPNISGWQINPLGFIFVNEVTISI